MPIPFILLLLVTALILWRRKPKLSVSLTAVATFYLALSSWHPIADRALAPFEQGHLVFDLSQPVDVVVVLGGCHASDSSVPVAAQLCSSSLFRLVEGLRILAANPEAQLFVSGYAGTDSRPHAEVMQEVAISLGVDKQKIITFPKPKDTQEEAEYMQPLLQSKRFALVTEHSHLSRALIFFQQVGLEPIPAPALKMSSDNFDWRISAQAAMKSERAVYEFLGKLWQTVKQ